MWPPEYMNSIQIMLANSVVWEIVVNYSRSISDPHLQPFYLHCDICNVNRLHVVAKLETLQEDFSLIRELTNDKSATRNDLPVIRSSTQSKHKLNATLTSTEELMKQVGQDLYDKLIDIYRIDFLLFGYSVDQYSPKLLTK